MYAIVTKEHDALADDLGYDKLYALVKQRRSYLQIIAVFAVLRSGKSYGISENTT